MLVITAILFVLGVLPVYVAGQLVVEAKCIPGYEWTYNKERQSPCYVAGALAAVCAPGGQFNVPSLPTGYSYVGPTMAGANPCRCSSIVYSLISACGYCQGRSYITWSAYISNCTTPCIGVYNYPIPSGVAVPAWAYLDVVTNNGFNTTQARLSTGTESTGTGPAPTVAST